MVAAAGPAPAVSGAPTVLLPLLLLLLLLVLRMLGAAVAFMWCAPGLLGAAVVRFTCVGCAVLSTGAAVVRLVGVGVGAAERAVGCAVRFTGAGVTAAVGFTVRRFVGAGLGAADVTGCTQQNSTQDMLT